jgi:RNA polymerase sigma-70 factor (ECF subfamily)
MRPDGNSNDQDLIAKAKQGNMDAFESLVRKYQRMVYFLCHRITGAHQTADDLSQETFLKAFVALPHFIDGHDFYSWIRRIALNNCFNFLKKWKREGSLENEERLARPNFLSSPSESPSRAAERGEMEARFNEGFRALPADQRVVFALRAFENMSYEEIARALHIPAGTVMSRLNRARKKLRAHMEKFLRSR